MSVKVAVRVRPFNQRQKFLGCLCCIKMKDKTTILINPRDRNQKQHQFTFDYSLWSHDGFEELENGYLYPIDDRFIDQKRIFKQLGENIITNAWNGFNCCLFAYGQTGAGKSYSMIGYEANRGIVPMACEKIFQGIEKTQVRGKRQFQVTISMLEIYNQKVQDLFMHTSKRPPNGLKIRENKKFGVYVEGIHKFQVKNYHEIQRKMQQGAKNRSLAATLMNEYSSRAHTIVIIEFIQKQFITEQKINKKSSTLNLVDLAGSERIAKTGINNKDRLKQASQINKSLHTLGRVIEHLAEQAAGKGKNIAIPYRDSALTRILETALGGNSVTTMICAVSPANDNYQQTLSTLRYADQAKRIRNKPIINQSAVDKIIRELRQQNERLKEMLRIAKLKGINLEDTNNIQANIFEIQRQIRKTMQSFAINTDNQQEDISNIMMTQFVELPDPSEFNPYQILSVSSFDSSLNNKTFNVYLTNLSEDPMLSYKIKYSCESQLYVGNKNLKEGGNNKLILCGLGIQDRHCRIYEINEKYYVEPLSEQAADYTVVNGHPIQKAQQLYHNDRVIFGTNSVFIFKNHNNIQMRKNKSLKIIPEQKKGDKFTSKTKSSFGTNFNENQKNINKYKSEPINIRASFGNQSFLLQDLDQFDIIPKKSSKQQPQPKIQTSSQSQYTMTILQKDIDYQFAINQRQSKLETSTSFSSSTAQNHNNNDEMVRKLQDIQKQFQILMQENQTKIKLKEEEFRRELKRIEEEKQREKKKLMEDLKNKEMQAILIAKQKQKIEKARDKLIQLENQKKNKMKAARQSMLLEGYQNMSPQIQTKIQYIDKHHHHFHYQYNQLPNQFIQVNDPNKFVEKEEHRGNKVQKSSLFSNQQISKPEQNAEFSNNYEINTTNSTTMMGNFQQSMLLELPPTPTNIPESTIKPAKTNSKIQISQQPQANISINANLDPEEARKIFIDEVNNSEQIINKTTKSKIQRTIQEPINLKKKVSQPNPIQKSSFSEIDISTMLDMPKQNQKQGNYQYNEEESNLLNMSQSFPLQCYISTKKPQQFPEQKQTPLITESPKQTLPDISLNFSQDELSITQQLKEQELNDKIRQLEQKLKALTQKEQQKKQTIKTIRKSFIQGFGETPNSQNFFVEGTNFDEEFQISMISERKSSDNQIQKMQFQSKLKMKMVQCQNENILNQRSLQVRKRKREADELRELYIKKQKRQIQKQLIQLIPMLEKFNLWAREMSRNLQGRISIEYRNFTNYEILQALKSSTFKSKINIFIKILNYEEGRFYNWPISVFQNRYEILQDQFQKYLQNPDAVHFADKFNDPFWEPQGFQPHGISYLSLEPLCYALTFEGQIQFAYKGHVIATMEVSICPNDHNTKLKQKFADQVITQQLHDPRQLLEKDLYFTLTIDKLIPTEHLELFKIEKFKISYDLIEDGFRTRTYQTPQFSVKKLDIMYAMRHSFRNITEHTLAYLADSPICFTLNALFDLDDELSNMTSSFLNSQSNLNLSNSFTENNDSGGSKSDLSAVLSVSTTSPSSFKKKSPVVFENTQILGKIEKDYNSAESKKAKASKQPSSSSSRKKQKHNQKQCSIF